MFLCYRVLVLYCFFLFFFFFTFFFFQAEDGIRDLVRSRGLGDVYKRQEEDHDLNYMQIQHSHLQIEYHSIKIYLLGCCIPPKDPF